MAKFEDIEPAAGMRTFAKAVREIFVALQKEGFTQQQALSIVADVVRTSILRNNNE